VSSGAPCRFSAQEGFSCATSTCFDGVLSPGRCTERAPSNGKILAYQKITNQDVGPNTLYFATAIAHLGDLDGDMTQDIAVGSYFDSVYILFLEGDGTVKRHSIIREGQGNFINSTVRYRDNFGATLGVVGDVDGDGVVDLAVGAYGDDAGGQNSVNDCCGNSGAVYILFLTEEGTVKSFQKIGNSTKSSGFTNVLQNGNWFGISISGLGDLDGDQVPDLAVGASHDDGSESSNLGDQGAVYILFLTTGGTVKSFEKIDFIALGEDSLDWQDYFGCSVASAEGLPGPGTGAEGILAVGAFGDDDGGSLGLESQNGAVWILFLSENGTLNSQQKISQSSGNFDGVLLDSSAFGIRAAFIGDVDGDGTTDLAVGSPDNNPGDVWLLFLASDGTVKAHERIYYLVSSGGTFLGPLMNDDAFGYAVAGLGDLNGDGLVDLAVAARFDGINDDGAVWILFLNEVPT